MKATTKKTSVQWLIDYCDKEVGYIPIEIINQAKEMEREQIANAYQQGEWNQGCSGDANEYIEKTYGHESNT